MHYHSTCRGCLTPRENEYYDVSGMNPGGSAFETEEAAQQDVDYENSANYMKGWSGHRQYVAPCASMHCSTYKYGHRVKLKGGSE